MHPLKLITTDDGSHSLYREDLREGYHSYHGALQESKHVFIKHGLEAWWEVNPDQTVKVLEVGLGTALNALLTWERAHAAERKVEYVSFEAFPVPADIWQQLNYPDLLTDPAEARATLEAMHRANWDAGMQGYGEYFGLDKREAKIEAVELPEAAFDLIYFDAFAPNKQGELWEVGVLEQMANTLKSGGYLTTYCARGQFKRDLKAVGLRVETLPGAPGKAEMVRAVKD